MNAWKKIEEKESIEHIIEKSKEIIENTKDSDKPTKKIKKLMENYIPRDPLYVLADIILPENVITQFNNMFSLIKYHDELYNEWGLSEIDKRGKRIAINLYGPPGTGKTMSAEAIAAYFDKKIIEVSYAEIESKYVGETPKNITASFMKAKEVDAVLFFDEADSILGKRMTNVTQAADHGVNVSRAVMLKQLDQFDGIVIFATNLAKNYDSAFVRRILYNVELPIPDYSALTKLWDKLIPDKVPGKKGLSFTELAKESEGLTGGDIKNAVVMSLSEAIQRDKKSKKVTFDDIKKSIAYINKAKKEVGGVENNQKINIRTLKDLSKNND